jgi:hypothetical protein
MTLAGTRGPTVRSDKTVVNFGFSEAAPDAGLPVTVPDDLVDGATIGLGDRPQRAVGRVPHAQQVGDVVIARHAEDLAGLVLVADRRVAGADAAVGGGGSGA